MRILYNIFSGFFIFFFISKLFENVFIFNSNVNVLLNIIFCALIFGVFNAVTPLLITFLKQKRNVASFVIVSLIVMLLFYILMTYILNIISINVPSYIILGIDPFRVIIEDRTIAIIIATILSTILNTLNKVFHEQA